MEAKINTGSDNYLYCSVDPEVNNYLELYNSWQDCFDAIKPDIIFECEIRGYNESETNKVLEHYQIVFANHNGEWKEIH